MVILLFIPREGMRLNGGKVHTCLNSALDGASQLHGPDSIPGETACGIHSIGGYMGPKII
jgi:hypothetical protein